MMKEERQAVVREVESWLRTPHHHQGRVKGAYDIEPPGEPGGVDCLMLLAEVFHRAGMIERLPDIKYSHDGHLHRSDELVLQWVARYGHEIAEAGAQPADVVLFKFGRRFSHGGIIINPGWPRIIHAVLGHSVEYGNAVTITSNSHKPRERKVFRLDRWK